MAQRWPLDPHQPFVFLVPEEDLAGYDEGGGCPPWIAADYGRAMAETIDREILGVPIGPLASAETEPFDQIGLKARVLETQISGDCSSPLLWSHRPDSLRRLSGQEA